MFYVTGNFSFERVGDRVRIHYEDLMNTTDHWITLDEFARMVSVMGNDETTKGHDKVVGFLRGGV